MNEEEMAGRFLDLWVKEHTRENRGPDYERLKRRYVFMYNETPVKGRPTQAGLLQELRKQRVARGLPGPKTTEPSIEIVIFGLLTARDAVEGKED